MSKHHTLQPLAAHLLCVAVAEEPHVYVLARSRYGEYDGASACPDWGGIRRVARLAYQESLGAYKPLVAIVAKQGIRASASERSIEAVIKDELRICQERATVETWDRHRDSEGTLEYGWRQAVTPLQVCKPALLTLPMRKANLGLFDWGRDPGDATHQEFAHAYVGEPVEPHLARIVNFSAWAARSEEVEETLPVTWVEGGDTLGYLE